MKVVLLSALALLAIPTSCAFAPPQQQSKTRLALNLNFNSALINKAPKNPTVNGSATESNAAERPLVRVITVEVEPGRDEEFNEWQAEFDQLVAKLNLKATVEHFSSSPKGRKDGTLDATRKDSNGRHIDTAVMTFPSMKELEIWNKSKERLEWLERGQGKLYTPLSRTAIELEDDFLYKWISGENSSDGEPPPSKWRSSLVIIAGVYPSTIFVSKFVLPRFVIPFVPSLVTQPMVVQLAVAMTISTPTYTWLTVPLMFRLLGPFVLKPDPKHNARNAAVVVSSYLALLVGSLIAFGEMDYVRRMITTCFWSAKKWLPVGLP